MAAKASRRVEVQAKGSARKTALAALRTWRTTNRFAEAIISELNEVSPLNPPDRAFALELFYGVLRNRTLIDFWISEFRKTRIESELRDILRLGFYQILILRSPAHAAVNETVELARKSHRPVANAILRAACNQVDELEAAARARPLNVQFSHPSLLIERWTKNFGAQAAAELCAWNNRPPPLYARINSLKISIPGFLRKYPGSFVLPGSNNFVGLPNLLSTAIAHGECYIQDPSTAVACELLDPRPEERILDACAAPGGKTSYLAELMKNRGILVACDRDKRRLAVLQANLGRLGVQIDQVLEHDWLTDQVPPTIRALIPFDRILLDAPCSNTGVIRRRVDVRWRLRQRDFARMQRRQVAIVKRLIPLLKPGGTLVYSTCSIEPEENEEVVRDTIAAFPLFQANGERQLLPFREGVDGAYAARLIKVKRSPADEGVKLHPAGTMES